MENGLPPVHLPSPRKKHIQNDAGLRFATPPNILFLFLPHTIWNYCLRWSCLINPFSSYCILIRFFDFVCQNLSFYLLPIYTQGPLPTFDSAFYAVQIIRFPCLDFFSWLTFSWILAEFMFFGLFYVILSILIVFSLIASSLARGCPRTCKYNHGL